MCQKKNRIDSSGAPKTAPEPSAEQRRWARRLYRTAFLSGIGLSTLSLMVWTGAWVCQICRPELLGNLYQPGTLFFHSRGLLGSLFGLFILGFGYQAFPRFKGFLLPNPEIAFWGLLTYVGGTVVCLGGLVASLAGLGESLYALPMLALALMTLGALPFPWQVGKILNKQNTEDKAPYDAALLWGAIGLVLAPMGDLLGRIYGNDLGLEFKAQSLWMGLTVMPLVFGVCQRFMAGIFGVKAVTTSSSRAALLVLFLGLVFSILTQNYGQASWATPILAGSTLISGLMLRVNKWATCKVPEGDSSGHFFKLAAFNVMLSQGLALVVWVLGFRLDGAQAAALVLQEHGAILGIGALAILGTTFRVIPNLTSRKNDRLFAVSRWVLGAALTALVFRLAVPILGIFEIPVLPLLGVSGSALCLALLIWASILGQMLLRPFYPDLVISAPANVELENMTISRMLEDHPHALEILIDAGFSPLKNPAVRAAMAPTITLGGAAQRRGLDLLELKEAILHKRPYLHPEVPNSQESTDPGSMTLIQIAEIKGSLAGEVYQRYGLDACCGGGKTLFQACEAHKIPLDELVRELDLEAALPLKK